MRTTALVAATLRKQWSVCVITAIVDAVLSQNMPNWTVVVIESANERFIF